MSESIADSVNGTRMPILRTPSATGAGDGGAPAVQAAMATTRARSTGPSGPALLPRLLRCVDELVGVGLGQVDVRVLLDVLVELLQQPHLELRSARGHLPGVAVPPHAVLARLDVAVLVTAVVVRLELLRVLERGVRLDPLEGLHARVHDALDDVLVLRDVVGAGEDRDERGVAAERGAGRLDLGEDDQ